MKKILMLSALGLLAVAAGCSDRTIKSFFSKGAEIPSTVEPAPEASRASRAALAGIYDVRGTNPGGSGNYTGTATITETAGEYRIDWSVGNSYTGTGRRSGDTLSIEWGEGGAIVGTVKYNVESDGRLIGTWYTKSDPNNLGSEILIPRRTF